MGLFCREPVYEVYSEKLEPHTPWCCASHPYRSAQRQLGEVLRTGSCRYGLDGRVTVECHLAEHGSKRRQSAGYHATKTRTDGWQVVARKGCRDWWHPLAG